MSQHVMETCNEGDGLWLPLTEYSIKSGVSLSTIRRKIKRNDLTYRLEKGKYLILFGDSQPKPSGPMETPMHFESSEIPEIRRIEESVSSVEKSAKMVSDAYEYAIREKEERILFLETRNRELEHSVQELRLLVRVLEEKYDIRY